MRDRARVRLRGLRDRVAHGIAAPSWIVQHALGLPPKGVEPLGRARRAGVRSHVPPAGRGPTGLGGPARRRAVRRADDLVAEALRLAHCAYGGGGLLGRGLALVRVWWPSLCSLLRFVIGFVNMAYPLPLAGKRATCACATRAAQYVRNTGTMSPLPTPRRSPPSWLSRRCWSGFQRYVRIDTQSAATATRLAQHARASSSSAGCSSPSCTSAGSPTPTLDENGYVIGHAAGQAADAGAPVIGLIAHMDTTPDAPGAGVEPIVHRAYDGGVIELPRAGTRLDPATMPELRDKLGHDIVTSSGDTLLGADDKAGVAEIMAAVAHLAAHPELPRPTLRVAFTPDEEIGEGATLFDIERFGALCAYTLDGSELGELQDETFSAVEAHRHGPRASTCIPARPPASWSTPCGSPPQIVAALPADRSRPRRPPGARASSIRYELTGTAGERQIRAIVRDFDESGWPSTSRCCERTAEEVVGARAARRGSSSRSAASTATCAATSTPCPT